MVFFALADTQTSPKPEDTMVCTCSVFRQMNASRFFVFAQLVFSQIFVLAQERDFLVQGYVKALHGSPVAGAHIYSTVSKQVIAITDLNGNYSIRKDALSASDFVTISHIGFKSVKIPADSIERISYLELMPLADTLTNVTIHSLTAKEFFLKCVHNSLKARTGIQKKLEPLRVFQLDTLGLGEPTSGQSIADVLGRFQREAYDSIVSPWYFDFLTSRAGVFNFEQLEDWTFSFVQSEVESPEVHIVRCTRESVGENVFEVRVSDSWVILSVSFRYYWKNPVFLTADHLFYSINAIWGKTTFDPNTIQLSYVSVTTEYFIWKQDPVFSRKQPFAALLVTRVLNP